MSEFELKKCYAYGWPIRIIYGLLGGCAALLFSSFLALAILIIVATIVTQQIDPNSLAFSALSIVLAVPFFTIFLNLGQTICITEKYLESRFFYFFRVRIPWEDITDIRFSTIPSA